MPLDKRSGVWQNKLRIAWLFGIISIGALLLVAQASDPLPLRDDTSLVNSHGHLDSESMPSAVAAGAAAEKAQAEGAGGREETLLDADEAAENAELSASRVSLGTQRRLLWPFQKREAASLKKGAQAEGESAVDEEADEDEAAESEGIAIGGGSRGAQWQSPVRIFKEGTPGTKAEIIYRGISGGRGGSAMCGWMPEVWLPSPQLVGLRAPEGGDSPDSQRRRLQQRSHPIRTGGLVLPREDEEQWLRANLEAAAAGGAGDEEELEELREEVWPFRSSSWGGPASRSLLGFTVMGAGCAKTKQYRVGHENEGAGPKMRRNVKPSEKPLVDCIKDPKNCGEQARKAARLLRGVKMISASQGKLRVPGLAQKYGLGKGNQRTCALVGNAGHLSQAHYGPHIDSHDVVVRFNVQKAAEFSNFVGNKTSLRVVNHRRSLDMCCGGNWPEAKAGIEDSGMMLWFPAAQGEITSKCKRRFPKNPRFIFPKGVISAEVRAMNMMRRDLARLGFGPFGDWRQMTSGSHAALLFSAVCDSVSLFGFTTYGANSAGGADQYAAAIGGKGGARTKARSGEKWHDWKGEKFVLRLMHAAGLINICSM